jgi:hypothetical protein
MTSIGLHALDLVLLLQQTDRHASLTQVRLLGRRGPGREPVLDVATVVQFVRHDSLNPKSAAFCFRS